MARGGWRGPSHPGTRGPACVRLVCSWFGPRCSGRIIARLTTPLIPHGPVCSPAWAPAPQSPSETPPPQREAGRPGCRPGLGGEGPLHLCPCREASRARPSLAQPTKAAPSPPPVPVSRLAGREGPMGSDPGAPVPGRRTGILVPARGPGCGQTRQGQVHVCGELIALSSLGKDPLAKPPNGAVYLPTCQDFAKTKILQATCSPSVGVAPGSAAPGAWDGFTLLPCHQNLRNCVRQAVSHGGLPLCAS